MITHNLALIFLGHPAGVVCLPKRRHEHRVRARGPAIHRRLRVANVGRDTFE